MPSTIAEKILAYHAGAEEVSPGELINASVDFALGNDITAPIAIEAFRQIGATKVFNPSRIALIADHFVPNKDIESAEQVKRMRTFAREYRIKHFYETGKMGVEHALLPEMGLVVPGDLVIGADSHTCTYGALGAFATGVGSTDFAAAMATGEVWLRVPESIKFVYHGKPSKWVSGKDLILHTIGRIGVDGALYRAMEFSGDTLSFLSMADRLAMCNMAVEAGAKAGIMEPDRITLEYVKARAQRKFKRYVSDPEAHYREVLKFDARKIGLQVAYPPLPSNTRPVEEASGVPIDQVVIGSCTNGRIEDMRVAAKILRRNKVHRNIRCLIIPATPTVFKQCSKEGLMDTFLEAGAAVCTPTCGPCLGGHMGILAEGERALATTNRNFVGRMGHPRSEVYLAGPAVAAATAIRGKISSPEQVLSKRSRKK
ncbi:MAG: 3-isopropylmalate dehydratase large subunit [Candidatus Abyssobacteria bacterium SURF_17]|uniref:3-isopropylmalate dehydratase large subunit n=1 Tax=Candidatus Abyssobacteria bacterium SURF_17 TaxID=2093361 RepID=A0A419EZG5_9BACT|nr:MAG: 3-isopropylmalate dehydratase large subunit [Candidatus Abyssubacteria bacterium SURF_17]